jgi:ABC-type Fe3+ transport system permease subunit
MENTENLSNYSFALQSVKKSSGWMKFLSILIMLISLLLLILGLFFGNMKNLFSSLADKVPQLAMIESFGSLIAVVIIVVAAIYGYMGFLIYSSAGGASKLGYSDDDAALSTYATNFSRYLLITVIFGVLGIIFSLISLIA